MIPEAKITHENINSVEKYLESNHNQRVTVNQIKKFMDWSRLKELLAYNIKKILKEFSSYRYKTLHEIYPKTFGQNDIRQFFKSLIFKLCYNLMG